MMWHYMWCHTFDLRSTFLNVLSRSGLIHAHEAETRHSKFIRKGWKKTFWLYFMRVGENDSICDCMIACKWWCDCREREREIEYSCLNNIEWKLEQILVCISDSSYTLRCTGKTNVFNILYNLHWIVA